MTFQQTFSKKITSSATKKPETPDYSIENPLAKDIYVSTIQCLLDTHFSAYGIITVLINGIVILKPDDIGTYAKSKTLSIPLQNQILKRNEKVEIFIWSGQAGQTVSLSASIVLSEDPNSNVIPETPLSTNELNQEISDTYVDSQTQHTIDSLNKMISAINNNNESIKLEESAIISQLKELQGSITSQNINHVFISEQFDELISMVNTNAEISQQVIKTDNIYSSITGLPASTNTVLEQLSLIRATLNSNEPTSVTVSELKSLRDTLKLIPNYSPQALKKLNDLLYVLSLHDNSLIDEQMTNAANAAVTRGVRIQIQNFGLDVDNPNISLETFKIELINLMSYIDTFFPEEFKASRILHTLETNLSSPNPTSALIIPKIEEIHQLITSFPSDRTLLLHLTSEIKNLILNSAPTQDIIQKINEAKSIVDSLSALYTTNADLLSSIHSSISSGNYTASQMEAAINSLISQTDDAGIIEKLNAIKEGISEIDGFTANIPEIITSLDLELNSATDTNYKDTLKSLQLQFTSLVDGWDIDELETTILLLLSSKDTIKSNNSKLGQSLDSLVLHLQEIQSQLSLKKSTSSYLFEKKVYSNETVTNLLNTKGNRNLIVLISASDIKSPATLDPIIFPTDIPFPVEYDYSGNTISGTQSNITRTKETRYDFHHPDFTTRNFNLRADSNTSVKIANGHCIIYYPANSVTNRGGHYITYGWVREANYIRHFDVYESADYNFATQTQLLTNATIDQLNSIIGSKRYVRIVETMFIIVKSSTTSSNQTNVPANKSASTTCRVNSSGIFDVHSTIFSPIDLAISGGTVKISFEVKGHDDEWFEFIPADEIGSISTGGKIVFEVGEAVSGHVLPSTQTHFRAKLNVVGSVETAVSLIRVA